MGRAIRGIGVVVLAGMLAACETAGNAADTVSLLWSDPLILKCPKYRVIAEAANLVKFRPGAGHDLTDVNFDGKIVDARLGCSSFVDKKTLKGTQEVELVLIIQARRGPANRNRKAKFPYIVRIVDSSDYSKILWAEDFTVSVNFPGNKTTVLFRTEPIDLTLEISERWTNLNYTLFMGFKLTRDELKFNRRLAAQQKR